MRSGHDNIPPLFKLMQWRAERCYVGKEKIARGPSEG